MIKNHERYKKEYKIKGRNPSESVFESVKNGSRSPKVNVTPYLKLNLSPDDLSERIAQDLMYGEILWLFQSLLRKVDDLDLEEMLYEFLHGRHVGRELQKKVRKKTREYIDEKDIPENPFQTELKDAKPIHEIHEQREKLLKKGPRDLLEKLWLYRLRVDELLWMLDNSEGHLEWSRKDYEALKKKMEDTIPEDNTDDR